MAQPRALGVLLLLVALGLGSATALGDEQALVQRGAAALRELDVRDVVESQGAVDHRAFVDYVHEMTSKVKELARQLKANNVTVGVSGAVCSEKQLNDYAQAVQDFEQKKKDLSAALQRDFKANITAVVAKILAPLYEGGQRMATIAETAARPLLRDIIKAGLVTKFKPKRAYSASEVVRVSNKTDGALGSALSAHSEEFKAITQEQLMKVDLLLNSSVEELPNPDLVRKSVRMSPPVANWTEKGPADYGYWAAQKVMPLLGYRMLPLVAMPLAFIYNAPDKQEDVATFATTVVFPVIASMVGNVSAVLAHYAPTAEDVPHRLCHTCKEKYTAEVNDYDTGCLNACVDLVNSCVTAFDAECTQDARKCMECHTDHLASYDACLGNATHAKSIRKLRSLASLLEHATTPSGFNDFLGGLAQVTLS